MAQKDIEPLLNQVQLWWNRQHQDLRYTPEDLGYLFNSHGMLGGWQQDRNHVWRASELRLYVKASAVRASGMLEQPDAKVALQIANLLVPQPLSLEIDAIVDIIELAGAETIGDRHRAIRGLIGVGAALLMIMLLARESS